MALIVATDVQSYLGIDQTDNAIVAKINGFIASSWGEIEGFLNQNILLASTAIPQFANPKVNIEDGNGNDTFFLANFPLSVSAAFILEYRDTVLNGWTTIDSSLYEVEYGTGGKAPMLFYPSGFIGGTRNYRMTYQSGYATCPDEIKQINTELVAFELRQTRGIPNLDSERLAVSSVSDNKLQYSTNRAFLDLRPDLKTRLMKYKVMNL